MILDQKDEKSEGQMTPLGGYLAPEGSSGGLRAKNVNFPIGELTLTKKIEIRFPALVRVAIPKMQKRAK